ncbi:MAG: hypothetical protein Q7J64_01425 [Elusimicrobiota bacterium]|nr:hypothetical protein [Elusimicrobiota bacterium]
MMRLAGISLAALVAASCTRSPAPAPERFPIGMFGVRQVSEVDALAKEGFDTFMAEGGTETVRAMGVRARKLGMRLLTSPSAFQKAGAAPTDLPLDAWYVYDEPDVVGLSSAALAAELSAVKNWDPKTPVTFVIGQGSPAKTYAGIGDALMLDWYPVPHHPVGTVADEIDKAYWYTGGRPLWFLVQSFDWRDWPQGNPKKPRIGRFPDHSELRAMSYLAVVHGAKGLFYYTLKRGDGRSLLDWPELWQATARMAREMRAMQPIFSANRRVPLPFEPSPGGVEAACWRWRGRNYLVLVNRHPDKQLKMPAQLLDRNWRPLFEMRRDPKELLKAARGAHYLPPLRVLVLESRIQWRDLFVISRTSRTP